MSFVLAIAIHALVFLILFALHTSVTVRVQDPPADVTLSEPEAPGGGGGGGAAPVTSVETPLDPVPAIRPITARRPAAPDPSVVQSVSIEGAASSEGVGDGTGDGDGTGTGGGSGGGDGTAVGDGSAVGPRCGDPFNGIWVGRIYFPTPGTWSEITLTMTRSGERVSGTIVNHEWEGPRTRGRPIPCIDGGYEWRIRMPASGPIHDHTLAFDSDHYEVLPNSCWRQGHSYNPDRFVGRLDAEAERLELTWFDDGTLRAGQAIRFQRVGCVDDGSR